jgi:uncharacterized protein YdhG (YjbR/CyaY superfamily)
MTKADAASVDAYIAAQPQAAQEALQTVRRAIRRAIPGGEETISYKIPAFRVAGRVAIFFAGWTAHYSLYPVLPRIAAKLGDRLSPYQSSKGTVRFPLAEPVPEGLIEDIAVLLGKDAEERAAEARAKKARARKPAQAKVAD